MTTNPAAPPPPSPIESLSVRIRNWIAAGLFAALPVSPLHALIHAYVYEPMRVTTIASAVCNLTHAPKLRDCCVHRTSGMRDDLLLLTAADCNAILALELRDAPAHAPARFGAGEPFVFAGSIGTAGGMNDTPIQFFGPAAIHADPSTGNVFVTERERGSLRQFTTAAGDGTFSSSTVLASRPPGRRNGYGPMRFVNPCSIALSSDGKWLAVLDPGRAQLQRMNIDSRELITIAQFKPAVTAAIFDRSPHVAPDAFMFVCGPGQVLRLELSTGKLTPVWSCVTVSVNSDGDREPDWAFSPVAIVQLSARTLVVACERTHSIEAIDIASGAMRRIAGDGTGRSSERTAGKPVLPKAVVDGATALDTPSDFPTALALWRPRGSDGSASTTALVILDSSNAAVRVLSGSELEYDSFVSAPISVSYPPVNLKDYF